MGYDKRRYNIVELGSQEWGIQYEGGPLVRGFKSIGDATNEAQFEAENYVHVELPEPPRNLEESMMRAQTLKDELRTYVAENINPNQEIVDNYLADIQVADAYVSNYQMQREVDRMRSNDREVQSELDWDRAIANADERRKQLKADAIAIRNDPLATPEGVEQADGLAFQAELYYNSLVQEREAQMEVVNPTSFNLTNLFSSASSTINQYGSMVNDAISGISNQVGSFFSGITNDISTSVGTYGSSQLTTFGGGLSQNTPKSGTSLYNSSVGGSTANSQVADQRVRLSPKPAMRGRILTGVLEPLAETGGLVFPYTPQITYQHDVNYSMLDPVHANSDWHIYKSTPSVQLIISGPFTAQNVREAEYSLAAIHFLRTLTKMHFGDNSQDKGLPPPQVILDGYGTHMFNGLSVIVKHFDASLPDNVDYVEVQLGGGISKVPSMFNMSVTVVVQQTPKKAREFDWDSFASGELLQNKGWL